MFVLVGGLFVTVDCLLGFICKIGLIVHCLIWCRSFPGGVHDPPAGTKLMATRRSFWGKGLRKSKPESTSLVSVAKEETPTAPDARTTGRMPGLLL